MNSFGVTAHSAPNIHHLRTISTWKERFPTNIRNDKIGPLVLNHIPTDIDLGLGFQGHASSTHTLPEGGLPLFYGSCVTQAERRGSSLESFSESMFLYRALTENAQPTKAFVAMDKDNDRFKGFRVTVTNELDNSDVAYELSGSSEDGLADMQYAIETVRNGKPEVVLPLKERDVHQFLDALNIQRMCGDLSNGSIDDKLTRLLEESTAIETFRNGNFSLDTARVAQPQTVEAALRTQRIHKITKHIAYMLYTEQSGVFRKPDGEATYTHGASLTYTRNGRPAYNATFQAAINDPQQVMSYSERDGHFCAVSRIYRDRPTFFFTTLAEAAQKLSRL